MRLTITVAALGESTALRVSKSRLLLLAVNQAVPHDDPPFGAVGLETTLSLVITHLIEPGILDWSQALAKLTVNPARILGLPRGTLRVGADADITIIDPEASWTVRPEQFRSQSRNTPFAGARL